MTPPAKPSPKSPPGLPEARRETEAVIPVVDSERILSGSNEVVIRHNGRHYRLRCTRLGKLILTA